MELGVVACCPPAARHKTAPAPRCGLRSHRAERSTMDTLATHARRSLAGHHQRRWGPALPEASSVCHWWTHGCLPSDKRTAPSCCAMVLLPYVQFLLQQQTTTQHGGSARGALLHALLTARAQGDLHRVRHLVNAVLHLLARGIVEDDVLGIRTNDLALGDARRGPISRQGQGGGGGSRAAVTSLVAGPGPTGAR